MALSYRHDNLFLVTLLAFAVYNGLALYMEANPEKLNPSVHKELRVTCISKGPANDSLYWEIGIGESKALAVRDDKKVSSYYEDVKAEYKVNRRGHSTHMALVIQNPNTTYDATYYCYQVFTQNDYEHTVVGEANISVTLDETYAIRYLLEQAYDQEILMNYYDSIIGDHQKLIEKQTSRIRDLESRVKYYEYGVKSQGCKIDDLEEKDIHLNTSILQLNENIKEKKEAPKDNYTVAFSYGLSHVDLLVLGKSVVFRDEILKVGDGYDPETGVFTCSRSGLYVFHLSMQTRRDKDIIKAHIRHNGVAKASVVGWEDNFVDQVSVSCVVSARPGDTVSVVPFLMNMKMMRAEHFDHFTVFSGYLLKLM